MRLLNDLSQDELVALTPEEKKQVYLLELAERGIALPSATPEYIESPDERGDLKPDTAYYAIAHGYSDEYHFETMEDARAVAALITETAVNTDYDYTGGTKYFHKKDGKIEVDIKTVPAYSRDHYAKVREELKVYNEEKTRIEKNNTRRADIQNKQAAVMSEIDEAILEAQTKTTRVTEFAGMFAEYKKMSEGNHDIAVRFMLNAHYDEVSKYEDQYLERIGITRNDITEYEAKSFGNAEEADEE